MIKHTQRAHNFFKKLYVTTTNFEDTVVVWDFISTGLMLLNLGAVAIEYSFDGTNVCGDMEPDKSSEGLVFDNRKEDKIYFRLSEVGPSSIVRVEAWGG